MRKLFLDTNVFLRFFLKDNEKQYQDVCKIFSKIEEGEFKPYTSAIVFLEFNYVARKIYKLSISETIGFIEAIRKMRGMTIIKKTDINKAINFYRRYKIKLGDCFIAAQVAKGTMLITYGQDFGKVKEIISKTPEAILNNVSDKN